jgi:predicted PurR-regulated permease PerM
MQMTTVNKSVLLVLVLAITALFLSMIRPFIMAVLLAGIFSSLAKPLYDRLLRVTRGHRALGSVATLAVIVLVVIVPVGFLLGVVTSQAIKVANSVAPWVEQRLEHPDEAVVWLQQQPFYERIAPYEDDILQKAGEIVGAVSRFLVNSLSTATSGTVQFFFMLAIMLYAMFFFLIDGEKLLDRILWYLPLEDKDERRLLDKFRSVTRATLKGTAVIGILQGGLAGLALWVVGIPSALFWSVIMMVLSIIPGIGTGLVWLPAAVILVAGGAWAKGVGLALFCGLVVGSIDNFLRPRLVGQDTQMPDLLILLSTLGGITLFGILGFIVGPIVAALFVTVWEIYGVVFRDVLPPGRGAHASVEAPPEK